MSVHVTDRQRQVLLFIQRFHDARGGAPTEVEIAVGLGMKHSSLAADHVRTLVRRGLVDRKPRVSRTIRLTALGRESLELPVETGARVLEERTALLARAAELLAQIVPNAPLLAEIQKEIA